MMPDPLEPDLNVFQTRVVAAIDAGRQLEARFFMDAVRDSAIAMGLLPDEDTKFIFVLDEYEQLFGRLRWAVARDDYLQYTVAHPLLSQMASFGQENLLVLLGQKPDAHHILMTYNQLSPLARQDSFPLFEHGVGRTDSEFVQFLQRVMSPLVEFEGDFADAVYGETSGHPYLTVNLMIDVLDWLMARRGRGDAALLSQNDFGSFKATQLTTVALQRNPTYSFMQGLIGDALSGETRDRDRWLYSVMSVMRRIVIDNPRTLSCSELEFKVMVTRMETEYQGREAELLRSAQRGNFLRLVDGRVSAAIPLLGRLAGGVAPR